MIVPSSEDISDWDRNFINVDKETLFEIINAANYLEVKGLLELGCKTVANMIKGKSVEEMRVILGIPADSTTPQV